MLKRLIAVVFIFGCTAIAWLILGSTVVLRTDVHEARELLNFSMAGWVLAWSGLPVAFIWLVRLQGQRMLRALAWRAGSVAAAVLVAILATLAISRDMTSFMRNEREARYLITPGNYLYGLAVSSRERVADARATRETVGGVPAVAAGGHVRLTDAVGLVAVAEPREGGVLKPVVGFRG